MRREIRLLILGGILAFLGVVAVPASVRALKPDQSELRPLFALTD